MKRFHLCMKTINPKGIFIFFRAKIPGAAGDFYILPRVLPFIQKFGTSLAF
ncbi:hypothetical protein J2Z22_002553 [Paenibacillus forsythiae]|uniref:Uncharacterized protein n=1 Tax=Paenibacillus forsythiae TaxID=365616 RepID=A0ABU3H861_9BACL|nr:hypothetical protein [Paenibacillus forsythiae]